MRESKEESVAVIYAGGDKTVDKDGGGVRAEGGAETIYIT